MSNVDQDSDELRFDNPESDGEIGLLEPGLLDDSSARGSSIASDEKADEESRESSEADSATVLRAGVQERLNRLFGDQDEDDQSEESLKGGDNSKFDAAQPSHEAQVFPPEVFSSASVPGARRVRSDDPRALDLRIEGLLFVTNVPMTIDEIARVLEVDVKDARDTLAIMVKNFSRRRSALELRERMRRGRPAFIIDLKPQYRPDVKPLVPPSIPRRILETLAIIAMNQPMNQARLVRDLGTKVYDHVRELIERGLISKSREGISYTLRTTPRFSSEFGISANPKDLRSMLARKMTPTELEAWDSYQRIHQSNPMAAAAEAYENAAEQAAEELLAESGLAQVRRPIPVLDGDEGELAPSRSEVDSAESSDWQKEMEAALEGAPTPPPSPALLPEPVRASALQATAPARQSSLETSETKRSTNNSAPIDSGFEKRTGSGPVQVRGERTSSETIAVDASALDLPERRDEGMSTDVAEAEAELGRPMTRFEKLFLELKNKRR